MYHQLTASTNLAMKNVGGVLSQTPLLCWNVQARNEVRVLASLNHPNIVKYFETFIEEKSGKLQIVMEYCDVSAYPSLKGIPLIH